MRDVREVEVRGGEGAEGDEGGDVRRRGRTMIGG